jgi:hypothetical protein
MELRDQFMNNGDISGPLMGLDAKSKKEERNQSLLMALYRTIATKFTKTAIKKRT